MKLETLQLFSYELALKRPIVFKNETLTTRKGLLLEMKDSKGRQVVSDIAPLPYFSPESLPATLEVYSQIKDVLLKSHWSLKLLLAKKNILHECLCPQKFPSLFFGFEFALLSLMMPRFCIRPHVPINLLMMGSDSIILEKIKEASNYSRLKVKVGPRTPEKMLELIEKITPLLKPHQKLRLDVNRSWSLRQTLFFCEHFPIELCDYLEEPLKDPKEYLTLSSYCSHPLAFDESLLDTPLNFILSIPTKKAFVIKPTLIGSLQEINRFYQKACRYKLDFVLSSSFESGLGHLMIAHLSRYLGLEAPMGLDTYHWLKEDVLAESLHFDQGLLYLEKENLFKPKLNKELLKPIYV